MNAVISSCASLTVVCSTVHEEGGIDGTREGYRIGVVLADFEDRRERHDDQVVMGEVVTQRFLEPVGIVESRAGSRRCPDPQDIDGMGRRRPLDLADADWLAGHPRIKLIGVVRLGGRIDEQRIDAACREAVAE
jgi:hypothetical protein